MAFESCAPTLPSTLPHGQLVGGGLSCLVMERTFSEQSEAARMVGTLLVIITGHQLQNVQ